VNVVLPDVDQRVLLCKLRESDAELRSVAAITSDDDRLECRRRELMLCVIARRLADAVADLDLAEAQSFPTAPAETDGRCTQARVRKTAIAVTLSSSSRPSAVGRAFESSRKTFGRMRPSRRSRRVRS